MTYHTEYMTAGDPDCRHTNWVTHRTHEVSSCVECGAVKEVIMTARVEELARVLLALEWTVSNGSGWAFCPSCWVQKDGCINGVHVCPPDTHATDCALDACLRKAGVR